MTTSVFSFLRLTPVGNGHIDPQADEVRTASSFFVGQSETRGSCRHKSLVLATLLRHYGIDAEIHSGWIGPRIGIPNHVWVYLPGSKMIADPMNLPEPAPATSYFGIVGVTPASEKPAKRPAPAVPQPHGPPAGYNEG